MQSLERVSYTRMKDGTKEDYELMVRLARDDRDFVVDNCLVLLKQMDDGGGALQVNRYIHSLQTATRAMRDGADEETIVCALLHDIGDMIAPDNHSEISAAILKPFVSDENHWVIKNHGLFQGYYYFHHFDLDRNARDAYKDDPNYAACVRFCERWDQSSFDPEYDTMPLDAFEPLVREVFARERRSFV